MEMLSMSTKEISRVAVIEKVIDKRMSQKEAGAILKLEVRQIKRLVKKYRQHGAAGLISKHRGRKGNTQVAGYPQQQHHQIGGGPFGPYPGCQVQSR